MLEKNAAFSEHSTTGIILHSNSLSVTQARGAELMDFLDVAVGYITFKKLLFGGNSKFCSLSQWYASELISST